MRERLIELIKSVLGEAGEKGLIKAEKLPPVILEVPKREEFGDYSTNIAMLIAPGEKRPAAEIAAPLARMLSSSKIVSRCEVAGKGFINIFLESSYWTSVLEDIFKKGESYGDVPIGYGHKVQIEFVSANPTGPLHIGHGRGAAVGDALARIFKATGFEVTKEYYINDVGGQMETLGRSLYLRYLELLGEKAEFPDDHYKGAYIKKIARDFITKYGNKYRDKPSKETHRLFTDFAKDSILEGIKKDLEDFAVSYDEWYSERDLYISNYVHRTIDVLRDAGYVYERDGAEWFDTTEFGDDKDRVLIKADGSTTYFASDIAYHREKLVRGFETIVDVWGADHHGYKPRMKALFKALNEDEERLRVIFIQLVSLLRGGEPLAMSTRAGEFITLREVMDEVGTDACRFYFLMRRSDAPLDFDLELAKKQAPENPVYYVQYCHARILSIIEFAEEKGLTVPDEFDKEVFKRLELKEELAIIKHLGDFEDVVEKSTLSMEPHRITFYLQELAGLFHPYYNQTRVVTEDPELTRARLLLCKAVKTVVRKGLNFLGVSAPSEM
jgi:arginyl-tRNA synthetase